MRERGRGRERGEEIWQITWRPGFVCVLVQECVRHGDLFILPARKGEISALPPGRNEEAFGKAAAEGKPKGVHSFTSFADPLALFVEGAFYSLGLASAPVPAWHNPTLTSSSQGLLWSLPEGPAGNPGFSQPRQPKAGLPPALHPFLLSQKERALTPLP